MIVSILNQKGGVGKTTASVHLAYAFAVAGRKTLLIDLDPQANAGTTFFEELPKTGTIREPLLDRRYDIRESVYQAREDGAVVPNLFIIPANIHLEAAERNIYAMPHREKILKNQLKKIERDYDFILVDCPPRLNQLTINAIYAADLLLIPTVLDRYSLDGISDLFTTIEEVKEGEFPHYLIFKNAYDSREKKSNDLAESILRDLENHICVTAIRRTSLFKQAQQHNQTLFAYDPKSPACEDFINLSKEITSYAL